MSDNEALQTKVNSVESWLESETCYTVVQLGVISIGLINDWGLVVVGGDNRDFFVVDSGLTKNWDSYVAVT